VHAEERPIAVCTIDARCNCSVRDVQTLRAPLRVEGGRSDLDGRLAFANADLKL
jgi:hypothetical protein